MSLGVNFSRRRMMADGGGKKAEKEPKYVWAVYAAAYVKDDASATSGTVNLQNNITKMVSSAYTVGASGFTLTEAVATKPPSMKAGQYLVDMTTGNSSSTTGVYLYEINSIYTFGQYYTSWTRYSSKIEKGDTELFRVESDTMDYPENGIWDGDGYWYVLMTEE